MTARPAPLLPGATIGVLGGGQLGRMMALAARRMGYRICVLDRDRRCPTGQIADDVVLGTLDDTEAALRVAERSQVVTLDTEHTPAEVLERIARVTPVRPGASVLATIQDRAVQKRFLDSLGVAQATWAPVGSQDELAAALATVGVPAILKARRAGYDGKGQARIDAPADPAALRSDAAAAWRRIHEVPATLEAVVPFAREVSVVLARSVDGEVEVYPLAENVHRRHILHTTRAPAPMPAGRAAHAVALATRIAAALEHVGAMAVEMFELADGALLVNEIAPRTHNSGHYTYGACSTSQFEQHVRAVCGLRLGDPRALTGAVMVNLIGDLWAHGEPAWQHVLDRPEARLHLYGKLGAAPGRKMGHVLLLDDDTDRALATAEEILAALASTRR
ncbi:MAG TPA: 5-(carboxyamino)imidazole ribonucleotide synthase [Kofleriaceae bacterium]|nr:5-(carboxyamino)imidazole ribonucleotide synthase [Kofleriaceae bacterium]